MGHRFCCPPDDKSAPDDLAIENIPESKDPVINFERSFPFARTRIADFY